MKPRVPFPRTILRCLLLPALAQTAFAQTTHYVAIACTNPVPPYITWATAATNIQDAIDVSVSNDTVLVSNGVYATGGRVVYGAMTNRVAITNAITVQSVGGPAATSIIGANTESDAVRCVYVGPNAQLSGFTLTNGSASAGVDTLLERSGGGLWAASTAIISNCNITGNTAAEFGGGTYSGNLYECFISGNRSWKGAGSYTGVLYHCAVSGNIAVCEGGGAAASVLFDCLVIKNNVSAPGGTGCGSGGGTINCILHNCSIMNNYASGGGGCSGGILYNCTVGANAANYAAGGAGGATLYNCKVIENSANNYYSFGGGLSGCTLYNCLISGNSSGWGGGGGAYSCNLYNCTIVSNATSDRGGGSYFGGNVINCIIYHNKGGGTGSNYWKANGTEILYSCTAPNPGDTGTIDLPPQFISASDGDYRLASNSPCIDRGNNAYATNSATDLDGNPRIAYGVVDMGAYEAQFPVGYWVWAGAITNGQTNLRDSAAGDGYPNLLKYATGSSPTNSDGLAAMAGGVSNGVFALRFNRNTNASDVTLVVEGSDAATNDAPWNGIATNFVGSWGGATNVIESGTSTPVSVAVQDPAPPATNRFLRLRVTRP